MLPFGLAQFSLCVQGLRNCGPRGGMSGPQASQPCPEPGLVENPTDAHGFFGSHLLPTGACPTQGTWAVGETHLSSSSSSHPQKVKLLEESGLGIYCAVP